MARFFFDVSSGNPPIDFEGVECASLEEAKREAASLAGALLKDDPSLVWSAQPWRLTVRDDEDRQVLSLTFASDATIPGPVAGNVIAARGFFASRRNGAR